ncbi:hypothetical protein GCM10027059_25980 [Myceligenerans halotolerans]
MIRLKIDARKVTGLAACLASVGVATSRRVEQAVEHEKALAALAAVLGPRGVELALEEVARREELFRQGFARSPRQSADARLAALQSVLDDVAVARWVP